VGVERSQEQIKSTLRRYGADGFGVMEQRDQAAVMFQFKRLTIRIAIELPLRDSAEFTSTGTGRRRRENAALLAYEQSVRQRWRALLLAIKAKLEAVETGISTLETEFMPFVVMPDGRTIGQHLLPRLEAAASSGKLPQLALPLPAGA
jgi:hypothetical protein